jgi:hypothetical protein
MPGMEIMSKKSKQKTAYNMAINYWFAPLYQKEFPCPVCRKYFNYDIYADSLQALSMTRALKSDNDLTNI